jgi:nucleotide-binding universal stress UspA family protein
MAYRKILVPLDGSEIAERALSYVQAIARTKSTKVILLTVLAAHEGRSDHPMKAYLDSQAKELESKGIKVSTAIAYGHAAEQIIEFAENNKINLIVISSHGHSGIKLRLLGSIAQKVLHGTCVPTLLVKPGAIEVSQVELKKVLLPLDGSSFSEASIPYVNQLLKGPGAEIVLLHVSEPPVVPPDWSRDTKSHMKEYRERLTSELQQQALEYLEKIKAALGRKGLRVRAKAVVGMAVESIIEAAKKENVDLIAMTTHGRTGVSRWMYGGVVNRIVEECQKPILLIRPCRPEGPRP